MTAGTAVGRVGPKDSTEFVVNGQEFRRVLKNGHRETTWAKLNPDGTSKALSRETRRCIRRAWKTRSAHVGVVRFPRLKPADEVFDGFNLTWKNAPRFDPDKSDDRKWLIDFFLAEKSVNLIYAPAGSFKSTLMLYAARCVAGGLDFLGMKTLRRRVLYLDYENPAPVIKARSLDFQLKLPENEYLIIWDRFGSTPAPHPRDRALRKFVQNCIKRDGVGPCVSAGAKIPIVPAEFSPPLTW